LPVLLPPELPPPLTGYRSCEGSFSLPQSGRSQPSSPLPPLVPPPDPPELPPFPFPLPLPLPLPPLGLPPLSPGQGTLNSVSAQILPLSSVTDLVLIQLPTPSGLE